MSQSPNINLAIIGLGKIAHKFASDVSIVAGVQLYAVASRDLVNAQQFAKEHQAIKAYGSYLELTQDPKVDLVYIATPNSVHCEHTLMCLKAKKAVICEKPFALNTAQVQEMITTAQEKRTFLMEALWTRFFRSTQKVMDIIKSGQLGVIQSIQADFGFAAPVDLDNRLYNNALGGGALLDIGIYPLYLSYLLLGVPERLEAEAQLSKTGVDTQTNIKLYYPNANAQLACSFINNTPTVALIKGDKGTLTMHSRFHHCNRISLDSQGSTKQVFEFDNRGFGYHYELAHAVACLREGRLQSPFCLWEDSLSLIGLLDEVRKKIGVNYPQD